MEQPTLTTAGVLAALVMTLGACGQQDDPSFGAPPVEAGLPSGDPRAAGPPSGSSDPGSTDPGTRGTPSSSATPSTRPSTTPSATPGGEATGGARAPVELGQPFGFASGLKVRVDRPTTFTPSAFVAPEPGTPVRFKVVVGNAGTDSYNPRHLKVVVQAGGEPAVQIFDSANAVVARPEKRILAGRTRSFQVGFWVAGTDDLVVTIDPGLDYPAVTVVG